LQNAGIISYSRGRIDVLDRARLEERSCECYASAKCEYDRLLPQACLGEPAPAVTPVLSVRHPAYPRSYAHAVTAVVVPPVVVRSRSLQLVDAWR
jgi:hypothetical protein